MIDPNKETTELKVTNGKSERFFVATMTWSTVTEYLSVNCYGIPVTNDHGYIPFLVLIYNLSPGLLQE